MLKIDTQGYEKEVLIGAKNSLKDIFLLQLEMSLVPLYKNELLFLEFIDFLGREGFRLYSFEQGFSDPVNGRMLQLDGIFINEKLQNKIQ
jgi:hypothetical protein